MMRISNPGATNSAKKTMPKTLFYLKTHRTDITQSGCQLTVIPGNDYLCCALTSRQTVTVSRYGTRDITYLSYTVVRGKTVCNSG